MKAMVMTTTATTPTRAQFIHTPVPKSGSEPEPEDMGKVLAKAMTRITEFVDPDKQESPRISVKKPDQFDGSCHDLIILISD